MQRRGIGVAPKALQRRGKIAAGGAFLGEQIVDDRDRLLGRESLISPDGDAFANR